MKKNRKQSKEHIKKLVASRRASPVWRIKISEGMKKKWADPEYKEMMRLAKINAFKNNIGNIRQNTIKAQKAAMEKTKNTTIKRGDFGSERDMKPRTKTNSGAIRKVRDTGTKVLKFLANK